MNYLNEPGNTSLISNEFKAQVYSNKCNTTTVYLQYANFHLQPFS